MSSIQQDPTPDLQPETLGALASVMIAQAQESLFYKATHGKYLHILMFCLKL